jgi:GNAT superfamily N-acetyltransferase
MAATLRGTARDTPEAGVRSLGCRTDLAMLRLQGSQIAVKPEYLMVRSPAMPMFQWGNALLYSQPPVSDELAKWVDDHRREFPGHTHVALWIDTTDGAVDVSTEAQELGVDIEQSQVMVTDATRPPVRPNTDAEFRQFEFDADWAAAVQLETLGSSDPDVSLDFNRRRMGSYRRLQDRGHGRWYGGFIDDRLVCSLGVFAVGDGWARYQNVGTHPDHRGRGLAGTLVHIAGEYALSRDDVDRLVIVADPGSVAYRIYERLKFTPVEVQTQVWRSPNRAGAQPDAAARGSE